MTTEALAELKRKNPRMNFCDKCPSDLQLSIPPEKRGPVWDKWMASQPLADPAAIASWMAILQAKKH
jgi:hypothetical protein